MYLSVVRFMNMISSTKGRIESFSRKVSKRTRDIFGYLSLQKYKRRGLLPE